MAPSDDARRRPPTPPAGEGGGVAFAGTGIVVRLRDVSKRFPGVLANDAVSLELRRGEVHCLLGENGSGKSTLIGMLAGLQQPDGGRIELDGEPVELRSPSASLAHGIGVVHQHSVLVPTMSVRENLMLGAGRGLPTDRAGGLDVDPRTPVGELGFGQRQQLEIELALLRASRALVLDEPTSMLAPQHVDGLLRRVRALAAGGLAVLFVAHKLREALAVADAVTVLRRGRVVERIAPAELARRDDEQITARLLAAMFGGAERAAEAPERGSLPRAQGAAETVGERSLSPLKGAAETIGERSLSQSKGAAETVGERSLSQLKGAAETVGERSLSLSKGTAEAAEDAGPAAGPVRPAVDAPVLLQVDRLATAPGDGGTPVADVSFELRAGELLGIAGIDGHGQKHLAEALAGQRACASGRIRLDGLDLAGTGVRDRRSLGLRYVTDDRLHEGIVGRLSVALNLVLKQIGERPFWRFGRMDRAAVSERARHAIDEYDIRAPSPETRAGTLSGGNIQKLLLARELADDPRVVIFDKPTHGLDLKTVDRVHRILRDFVRGGGAEGGDAEGGGALLISTDLDELVALCARILVLSNGRVVGVVENDGHRVAERVGELMVGAGAEAAA